MESAAFTGRAVLGDFAIAFRRHERGLPVANIPKGGTHGQCSREIRDLDQGKASSEICGAAVPAARAGGTPAPQTSHLRRRCPASPSATPGQAAPLGKRADTAHVRRRCLASRRDVVLNIMAACLASSREQCADTCRMRRRCHLQIVGRRPSRRHDDRANNVEGGSSREARTKRRVHSNVQPFPRNSSIGAQLTRSAAVAPAFRASARPQRTSARPPFE